MKLFFFSIKIFIKQVNILIELHQIMFCFLNLIFFHLYNLVRLHIELL